MRLKRAFSFGGSVFGEDEDVPDPPADCDGILEAFLTHVSIDKCRNSLNLSRDHFGNPSLL